MFLQQLAQSLRNRLRRLTSALKLTCFFKWIFEVCLRRPYEPLTQPYECHVTSNMSNSPCLRSSLARPVQKQLTQSLRRAYAELMQISADICQNLPARHPSAHIFFLFFFFFVFLFFFFFFFFFFLF